MEIRDEIKAWINNQGDKELNEFLKRVDEHLAMLRSRCDSYATDRKRMKK